MTIRFAGKIASFCLLFPNAFPALAQKDTLKVMTYNVLYYGNGCQGPNSYYHNYLKTITGYAQPDVLSLVKLASIPVSGEDKYGSAPPGFGDSILQFALNAENSGKYAYCPFTNNARSTNMCMLFYNQKKLGFVSIVSSYTNQIDFNTYKLYYKDPNLEKTHDTTFLYFTLNHDKSGDDMEQVRGQQIIGEMHGVQQHFHHLPNMINLGDFNARNSGEMFYQELIAPNDTGFRFFDPPFYPDHALTYPANWDHNAAFSKYLTTATRESGEVPNSCGTGGGAKNWYDHIFISPWISGNVNYVRYIPNSYKTIGNDGQRFKVGINNANAHQNSSCPPEVIDALYRMSNKYPVMISLEVTSNLQGISPTDPEINSASVYSKEEITIESPVLDKMVIHFPAAMQNVPVTLECTDASGVVQMTKTMTIKDSEDKIKCKLSPGIYTARFSARHNIVSEVRFEKQ
jgi:hypothetical protein